MKLFSKVKATILLATIGSLASAHATLLTFDYTGSVQQWVVPTNVSSIDIKAWGAQGQSNAGGVLGGLGGFVSGSLSVSAGDVLNIYVGGGGIISATGGWNGGGDAGLVGASQAFGGGGGGATDIRLNSTELLDRLFVAAGGGGAGGNRVAGQGRGTGGGGGAGYYGGGGGAAWPYQSLTLATGGTQTSGGNGGTSTYTSVSSNNGSAGSFGLGGNGGEEIKSSQGGSANAMAGGAGGGLQGDAGKYGANWTGQSGAGGSSYLGLLYDTSILTGERSGNGYLELEFNATASQPIAASSPATLAIMGLALGGLFWTRRKQQA